MKPDQNLIWAQFKKGDKQAYTHIYYQYFDHLYVLILLLLLTTTATLAQDKDYLFYAQEHCDNLIAHGKDDYGSQKSNMLASVIDTRDMSVPQSGVPATEGTRSHDRAVGGSNFYHDVETIKLFKALSKLTGNDLYQNAAVDYAQDFLTRCQNPYTGLLAWGEHLYYNFYADTVLVDEMTHPREKMYHEFLAETPPWTFLWEIDTTAVKKAIAGVRYHFRSPTTQSFLFNRHAYWHKQEGTEYRGLAQYQEGGQPWIKHSGLQCYSFTFLYDKTQAPEWKRWAEGTGSLYWKYRHPETNLTVSCIDDPRPNALYASLNSMSQLSYYLLKSWQLHPEFSHFRERAETMLKSAEKYAWDAERKGYYSLLNLDGSAFSDELIPVIHTGYKGSDILSFGRIAAYFYQTTGDDAYRVMVQKVADMVLNTSWPDDFVVNSLGFALQFSLDAYEILEDERLLQHARNYADIGIKKLWSGQMFVRQPDDPYYEAKLGTNNFVAGLLRLHLTVNNHSAEASLSQWTF